MSKQADRIRASAASLADLEEDFSTPAPKQYPAVPKSLPTPTEMPQSAAAGVGDTPSGELKLVEHPQSHAEQAGGAAEGGARRSAKRAPKAASVGEGGARRSPKRTTEAEALRATQPSRAGKVPINIWTREEKRRALKIHAVTVGTTVEELMNEALDDLMKKHKIRMG